MAIHKRNDGVAEIVMRRYAAGKCFAFAAGDGARSCMAHDIRRSPGRENCLYRVNDLPQLLSGLGISPLIESIPGVIYRKPCW